MRANIVKARELLTRMLYRYYPLFGQAKKKRTTYTHQFFSCPFYFYFFFQKYEALKTERCVCRIYYYDYIALKKNSRNMRSNKKGGQTRARHIRIYIL